MTRTFVAVDGGGSKTDVVVGDETGRVLACHRGPGSSPHSLGLDAAVNLLDSLVREALAVADLSMADRAELYLAGADLPIEVDALMSAVSELGWAGEHRVDNDLFALLRAGTADPNAIAVVCGSGINCVGCRADGKVARFLALGGVSGDWGGGRHLANLMLWHAARAEDGRGPATLLSGVVADHFRRPAVADVSIGLHLGEIDHTELDSLAPKLFDAASAGDPVARRVVNRQASEIVAMATVAADRLGLLDSDFAVVLGGGVLRARQPMLMDEVTAGMLAAAPKARISVADDLPVAGAALLALEAFGTITPAVEERIRGAVGDARQHTAFGTHDR